MDMLALYNGIRLTIEKTFSRQKGNKVDWMFGFAAIADLLWDLVWEKIYLIWDHSLEIKDHNLQTSLS